MESMSLCVTPEVHSAHFPKDWDAHDMKNPNLTWKGSLGRVHEMVQQGNMAQCWVGLVSLSPRTHGVRRDLTLKVCSDLTHRHTRHGTHVLTFITKTDK